MSFRLHLAAQSDELLAALRPALSQARADTLRLGSGVPRPVPVLVPSAQLGDWLQVRLARELGLSMGFEFLQPAAYLGRHLGGGAVAEELVRGRAYWAPDHLRWQLLPWIEAYAGHLGQEAARALSPRDRFAFAELLARQFDRYARYRPDWPERWARGQSAWSPVEGPFSPAALEDEGWQRELWRRLADAPDAPRHPAQVLAEIGEGAMTTALPPVFVVGTDLLDPLLLRSLTALARQGQTVSLYLLLPSLGYLGDIARRSGARPVLGEGGGHPLLASLGQQAVGSFLLLESVSPDYAAWPEDPAHDQADLVGPTLLQRLQADVRRQNPPPGAPRTPEATDVRPVLAADDASLRVHCCHSPRRELEVVRDELLRAFAEWPDLRPEDVMVAVTDFDTYAPLAEGILRSGSQPLPVRLTAIPAREANPVAVALLALLRLALGRGAASEVVELLNLTAIQQHLGVAGDTELLAGLADAVRRSGLTHGLDAAGAEAVGTWRAAVDRHLAGAWLGPVAAARDGAGVLVHPVAADLHFHDAVIARFAAWLTCLALQLEEWREPAPAARWAERLGRCVDTLLYSEEHDDHAAAVRRLTAELAAVTADPVLDAGSMLDWLEPQLENATSLRTSMGGEILFGRLDQLHGLPNRVLAVLGLQDGVFPRAGRRPAWDLTGHRPARWDGDPRAQDRQWLLDGLLTPANRLILTAANRSLRTAHDGPLSACVEDVLRAVADTVQPGPGWASVQAQIVVKHRIQPFASDYFSTGAAVPRSFDAAAARIAGDLAGGATAVHPFGAVPGPAGEAAAEVTLAQLVAFWRDPARAWLRALQLETAEETFDDTALDDAPLTLDALQAYGARAAALAGRLTPGGMDAAVTGSCLSADRALPPGVIGELHWKFQDDQVRPLAEGVARVLPGAVRRSLEVTLPDGGGRIVGEVTLVPDADGGRRVLVYRGGDYDKRPKYQLEPFVHTLAATVAAAANGAQVFGLDLPEGKRLVGFAADEARQILAALVAGYRAGQHGPLAFAPQTSEAIAQALADAADAGLALENAQESWGRTAFKDQPAGEGLAPAALLAWRDAAPFGEPYAEEWVRWAQRIAQPLRSWWGAGEPEAGARKKSPARRSV